MSSGGQTTVHLQAREGVPACSYCRGECRPPSASLGDPAGDAAVVCQGCQAHYHHDCLAELGACATIGCPTPRASKTRRVIVIKSPRCCHGAGATAGRVVLCDACGSRWHAECLARLRVGACCDGHGFSPEAGVGRARDRGPRVGSERSCTRCSASFRVEAATRYSPYCPSCRTWWNMVGLLLIAGLVIGYVLLGFLGTVLDRM